MADSSVCIILVRRCWSLIVSTPSMVAVAVAWILAAPKSASWGIDEKSHLSQSWMVSSGMVAWRRPMSSLAPMTSRMSRPACNKVMWRLRMQETTFIIVEVMLLIWSVHSRLRQSRIPRYLTVWWGLSSLICVCVGGHIIGCCKAVPSACLPMIYVLDVLSWSECLVINSAVHLFILFRVSRSSATIAVSSQ